jgi:hypothetical protein
MGKSYHVVVCQAAEVARDASSPPEVAYGQEAEHVEKDLIWQLEDEGLWNLNFFFFSFVHSAVGRISTSWGMAWRGEDEAAPFCAFRTSCSSALFTGGRGRLKAL